MPPNYQNIQAKYNSLLKENQKLKEENARLKFFIRKHKPTQLWSFRREYHAFCQPEYCGGVVENCFGVAFVALVIAEGRYYRMFVTAKLHDMGFEGFSLLNK
jgi:hypothetical protein